MNFFNQWSNRPEHAPLAFSEPTCTVPNQSMTVQEIIAKYSRTGLVPQSYLKKDAGGNAATDPDFDPLDSGYEVLEAAAAARTADTAAHGSGKDLQTDSSPEHANAPGGEGGD